MTGHLPRVLHCVLLDYTCIKEEGGDKMPVIAHFKQFRIHPEGRWKLTWAIAMTWALSSNTRNNQNNEPLGCFTDYKVFSNTILSIFTMENYDVRRLTVVVTTTLSKWREVDWFRELLQVTQLSQDSQELSLHAMGTFPYARCLFPTVPQLDALCWALSLQTIEYVRSEVGNMNDSLHRVFLCPEQGHSLSVSMTLYGRA